MGFRGPPVNIFGFPRTRTASRTLFGKAADTTSPPPGRVVYGVWTRLPLARPNDRADAPPVLSGPIALQRHDVRRAEPTWFATPRCRGQFPPILIGKRKMAPPSLVLGRRDLDHYGRPPSLPHIYYREATREK